MPWNWIRTAWLPSRPRSLAAGRNASILERLTGGAGTFLVVDGDGDLAGIEPQQVAWRTFKLRHGYPDGADSNLADAPFVLVVNASAADAERDEFRRWLDEEHCVRQLTVPGVRWFRGYEEAGAHHSFLNLWGIDDPSVVESEAWVRARDTEWWPRVAHIPASGDRGVYRPVPSPSEEFS